MSDAGGPQPGSADGSEGELSPADLAKLGPVPSGAVVLAGAAMLLLLIGWLFVYLAIYLPRGMVG